MALFVLAAACGGPPLPDGGGPDGSTPPDGGPDARPDASPDGTNNGAGALFPETVTNGKHASLAVDATGGVHLVYAATTSLEGVTPVRYGYCAAGCDERAGWTFVTIGDVGLGPGEPRLELDPAGRPRVLYYRAPGLDDGEYWYAACDGGCTRDAGWRRTRLAAGFSPSRSRYFALDPAGRPSFVYSDTREGHRATYWAFCAASCDAASNWHEVAIGSYLFADYALAYTPEGGARLAYRDGEQLAYLACDDACGAASAWRGEALYDLGSGASFALRLDARGRPRLALYTGHVTGNEDASDVLVYAACDAGCTSAANWSGRTLGLPARHGANGVDLALDAQGRPRVAFYIDAEPFGLGYARCDAACEAVGASWSFASVDGSEAVQGANPVPVESGCSLSVWFAGMYPSLALDPAGRPRFAYDAEHLQGGTCRVHTDVALVRFATTGAQ